MKKLTLFIAMLLFVPVVFAGGPLTNTNQSAQFIRMLSRNASTDIDAVYFNPAGLIKLDDGWHFAFHTQTIMQDKIVNSEFPLLNNPEYVGEVRVPVFPSVFGVYKKDKLALSVNFSPIGGGGSADFARGLPSFEIPITKIVPGLAGLTQIDPNLNVTGYDANLSFSGSSIFWGLQLGATYEVNEKFSVFGGVRYMPATNSYEGSIQNVQLKVASQNFGAAEWLNNTATYINQTIIPQVNGGIQQLSAGISQLNAGITAFSGAAASLQSAIDGGASSLTLADLQGMGMLDATSRAQLEGGLTQIGLSSQEIAAMNVATIQGTFSGAASNLQLQADGYSQQLTDLQSKLPVLQGTASTLTGTAAQLGDKHVETTQTGAGITPIIGVNISPNDDWNIALKYEPKTKLELTNDTKVDDLGLFPDGGTSNSDIPAMFTAGLGYSGLDWLEAQVSYNMYFGKGVDWGQNTRDLAIYKSVDPTKIRTREMEKNGYELGLGLQFNVSEKFAFSLGGLQSSSGAADSYQSDFSYSNSAFTVGGGIMWKITDKLVFDAGFSDTFYKDAVVEFTDPDLGKYSETLGKTTVNFAAGLSYSIF